MDKKLSKLAVVVVAGALCSGCLVHTKTVEHAVPGKIRTEIRPSTDARIRVSARQVEKGLEVAVWKFQQCTVRKYQDVEIFSKKEATVSGGNCSGDHCAAMAIIFAPVMIVSAIATAASVAGSEEEFVRSDRKFLSVRHKNCSGPVRHANVFGVVDGKSVSARTNRKGRAILTAHNDSDAGWFVRVDGLPGVIKTRTIDVAYPRKPWVVVYQDQDRAPVHTEKARRTPRSVGASNPAAADDQCAPILSAINATKDLEKRRLLEKQLPSRCKGQQGS
jgi:hypothetical protein